MEQSNSNSFLRADPDIVLFHSKVSALSQETENAIKDRHFKENKNNFLSGSLINISQNIFALHKAIFTLCKEGWAFACPMLLRTEFELLMAASIFFHSDTDEREYMAFKYSHYFLKANLYSSQMPKAEKTKSKECLKSEINKLPASQQCKATKFCFQEKLRGYWFCPEFQNPKEILIKFQDSDSQLHRIYEDFSGATHGGLLGLMSFRDDHHNIHSNPRPDKTSQNKALNFSSRLLLDFNYCRGVTEGLSIENQYFEYLNEFKKLCRD